MRRSDGAVISLRTPCEWKPRDETSPAVEPLVNTTFQGTNGIWASSNPLVMYVNQQGQAFSIAPGTAIITYTPPTGVRFNEWIMYVGQPTG